jgi:hypothetical protein
MSINFNPNLPPNDSLEPWEIDAKVAGRNAETRHLTEKAYKTGGVPDSAAERAANHSSVTRQTAEAKKDRRDAKTWSKAKRVWGEGDDDE